MPFEEIMRLKGMEQAFKLLQGYFNRGYKPLVNNRDEYFFEELKKIKYRFFEPIL